MDVRLVYTDPNGTLTVMPDAGAAGSSSLRPSSVPLAAAYLTLSSAAIAANAMVLTGIVTADRLRSPYAVLASALCLQCAMDAAVGHYATTRELVWAGSGDGGGGPVLCRLVATITATLSVVQLVTFAALACLDAFPRPGHDPQLPLSVSAALWAAPSAYTYVVLAPTMLFTARYFPSRGRCGFVANSNGWFYQTLLVVFGFAVPWSVALYSAFASRPPPSPSSSAAAALSKSSRGEVLPSRWLFAAYTALVAPALVTSFVRLYAGPAVADDTPPWAGDDAAADDHSADGYLSRMPILFDALAPLALVCRHKAYRKKCRELYMHGFRNSVSDDRGGASKRRGTDGLADDATVLFVERAGAISVRHPGASGGDHGFVARPCDVVPRDDDYDRIIGKKAVRFSGRTVGGANGIGAARGKSEQESRL